MAVSGKSGLEKNYSIWPDDLLSLLFFGGVHQLTASTSHQVSFSTLQVCAPANFQGGQASSVREYPPANEKTYPHHLEKPEFFSRLIPV